MTRRVRLITVCDNCFRFSCWAGEFMCEDARGAGTVKKTSAELRKLSLEHPSYFSRENVESVCGSLEYTTTPASQSPPADATREPSDA